MEKPLFSPELISKSITAMVHKDYILRPLCRSDYDKGVLQVLSHLTTVGVIEKSRFFQQYDYFQSHSHEYFIIVIEHIPSKRIVACGTMFLERKLIHNLSMVGHLEDVVTSPQVRGLQFGNIIINVLTDISEKMGAYKTILDCNAKNVTFYAAKCGFSLKEYQMSRYKNDGVPKSNL